jgi:hypothetical protein
LPAFQQGLIAGLVYVPTHGVTDLPEVTGWNEQIGERPRGRVLAGRIEAGKQQAHPLAVSLRQLQVGVVRRAWLLQPTPFLERAQRVVNEVLNLFQRILRRP